MRKFTLKQIIVTEEDLAEFEKVILQALCKQSPIPVISEPDINVNTLAKPEYFFDFQNSLVMSFDKNWYPFLCNTKGLNKGEQRWYIPNKSRMINLVSEALNDSKVVDFSREGGRVFINGTGVKRPLQDGKRIEILKWNLPRKSPILYSPEEVQVW